jgi:(S)-ureidoglycine aminohydrolase
MSNFVSTRSSIQRNHALITPESHVQSYLPGWRDTKAILLIAPAMGANFMQYIALLEPGGLSGPSAPGIERFCYVLEGEVEVTEGGGSRCLESGGFAYSPPDQPAQLRAIRASRLVVFEKPFVPAPGLTMPAPVVGQEQDIAAAPFLGDPAAMLKYLLPSSPAADMEVNLFAFAPGGSLPLVEVHLMEHGLLLLEGQGIYRLADQWYPVQAGDTIWMGPFCPQWFAALGKQPARYLYYKDVNRDPLEGAA